MKRHTISTLCSLLVALFAFKASYCHAQGYNQSWNKPTISHATWNYKYVYFGHTEPYDRSKSIDVNSIPPIPGLKYRSCYELCQQDTCYAVRAIMAMRCPDKPILLRWASKRAGWFVGWSKHGEQGSVEPETVPQLKSASNILNHYIRQLQSDINNQKHGEYLDHGIYNEQFGFLLTDCWQTGKYCTFYEATWYDWMSCGDQTKENYYSVNMETGVPAKLGDIVREDAFPKLADLLMKYLKNSNGRLWIDGLMESATIDPLEVLRSYNCCALIREGLVISYYPYAIGSGADGQITAVIPYSEITELLLNGK